MCLLAVEIACGQTGSHSEAKSTKYQFASVRRKFSSNKYENSMVSLLFQARFAKKVPLPIVRMWPHRILFPSGGGLQAGRPTRPGQGAFGTRMSRMDPKAIDTGSCAHFEFHRHGH